MIKAKKGDKILIVAEDPDLGWYDQRVVDLVLLEGKKLGLIITVISTGPPENSEKEKILNLLKEHDITIFLARVGDQIRFTNLKTQSKVVMCYSRTGYSLESNFGSINHQAMVEMKEATDKVFLRSKYAKITCPLGTSLEGKIKINDEKIISDVTISRFPMVVPRPIEAYTFSGQVVLSNYLTPTGSKVYSPAYLKLDETVTAQIRNGMIETFLGDSKVVKKVKDHYKMVASEFNLEKNIVHSFHAGLHPGCTYEKPKTIDPDHWSNTVFANPNYLHFHTCGNYAPGEICWMVSNQTILFDNVALWKKGRFAPDKFFETARVLKDWPELSRMYSSKYGSTTI